MYLTVAQLALAAEVVSKERRMHEQVTQLSANLRDVQMRLVRAQSAHSAISKQLVLALKEKEEKDVLVRRLSVELDQRGQQMTTALLLSAEASVGVAKQQEDLFKQLESVAKDREAVSKEQEEMAAIVAAYGR